MAGLVRYAFAGALVAVMAGLRVLLEPVLGSEVPYLPFLLPVLIAARYSGYGPALFATALGAIVATFYFFSPTDSTLPDLAQRLVWLLVFVGMGLSGVVIIESLQRARRGERDGFAARRQAVEALDTAHAERARLEEAYKVEHEELQQSESRLTLLIDSVKDYAIFMLDPEGRIASWNDGALRVKGYTAGEVLGRHVSMFYPPEDVAAGVPDRELETARTRGSFEGEGWRIRRDGQRFWALTVMTPVIEDGVLRGFAKVTRDLSDRRRHEVLLSAVLDNVLDAIIGIDASGRIESFNQTAERMLGYTVQEVMGRNVAMLMPEPYAAEHDGYIARYLATGDARIIGRGREVQARRKDGSIFPVDLSVGEFVVDGTKHFTGVLRDLTPRRRLEEQLRQAQKMEAMGLLAGGVAHDFNNLLTVIFGHSQLVIEDLPEGMVRSSVQAISDAAERAASLTNQLLLFSRRAVAEPRLVDLNALVRDSEKLLRRLIGADVVIRTVLDPSLPQILADPSHLDQVIMNLAVNARDAMPRGGQIVIETSAVALEKDTPGVPETLPPGTFVRLAVSDTGEGMSPEVRQRVFEPFFTTKEAGKGTGLGLSIVYGIVTQSGGHIEVYSEPAQGTVFKVYFPAAGAAGKVAAPHQESASATGSETILLVEDEHAVRALAATVLRSRGYRVLEAADGQEALELVDQRHGRVDLLLTDVVLPRMNGRELATALLARSPEIKVLYTSGYTPDAVLRYGVEQAEIALLQKPYSPARLATRVREILDGVPPVHS